MENSMAFTGSGDIGGNVSLKFQPGQNLISLCEAIFDHFNADDHEPIALRLYCGKENILTLYALDKVRQETSSTNPDKLPTRKFKQELTSPLVLLHNIAEINFTLEAGNFPLRDMEVINV